MLCIVQDTPATAKVAPSRKESTPRKRDPRQRQAALWPKGRVWRWEEPGFDLGVHLIRLPLSAFLGYGGKASPSAFHMVGIDPLAPPDVQEKLSGDLYPRLLFYIVREGHEAEDARLLDQQIAKRRASIGLVAIPIWDKGERSDTFELGGARQRRVAALVPADPQLRALYDFYLEEAKKPQGTRQEGGAA